MILGIVCLLTANSAILLGAHELFLRVRTGNRSVDFVLFILIRLLLISATIIGAGTAHLLAPLPLGVLGLLVLVVLLGRGAHRRVHRPTLPRVGILIGCLTAIILVRLFLQVWFFAPCLEDVLAYHLPKVAEWVQSGRFTTELGVHTHVTFPAGFELLETWWVVFLHHDVLIEMAGVEFLFLGFASVYALGKHLGLDDRWSFLGALGYSLSPGVTFQSTSCLNDGAVASLVLASSVLICRRVPSFLILLPIGLGIGVKPTFVYALTGLAVLVVLVRNEVPDRPKACCTDRALGLAAMIVGFFWYGRNLLVFGNPIYPVGLGGVIDSAGRRWIQFGPDPVALHSNLASLVNDRIADSAGGIGATLMGVSGWGAIGFSSGIVAVLTLLRSDVQLRRLSIAFTVSLLVILGLVLHDLWFMRFVLFFPALLVLAAAKMAVSNVGHRIVVGMALLLQFIGTFLPAELPSGDFLALVRQPWRERTAADVFDARYPGDKVGYFAGNKGEAYLLYGPSFSRRVVYLRARSEGELERELRRERIRVVYARPESQEQRNILAVAEEKGIVRPIHGRFYSVSDW